MSKKVITVENIRKNLWRDINLLRDEQGFIRAGSPRFLGLFGRDSLIVAWQLLDYDSSIAKNTLSILTRFQGKKMDFETEEEPGKILHEYYPKDISNDWWETYKAKHKRLKIGKKFYMSVDSTPLFLIVSAEYYEKTKDKAFILKLWPNILKAVDWIINYGDINKDGFTDYQRKNPHGLTNQGWKDSEEFRIKSPVAIVEVQGYVFFALKQIAKLAKIFKEKKLADELLQKSKILKKNLNQKFWMPKKEYFALALDGERQQFKEITSNPGHLLFTGILNKDKEKAVVKKLFSAEFWTPFGIRTHSTKSKLFSPLSYHLGSIWPHDNWIIAQGLKKSGYTREYQKIKTAIFDAYKKLKKIPEYYTVIGDKIIEIENACCPQAWSSGALLKFLTPLEKHKLLTG